MKVATPAIDRRAPSAARALPIAALTRAGRGVADALLADFAFRLRRNGWRVSGLVQQDTGGGKAGTMLVDIEEGTCFHLFQNLGPASTSCSVDSGNVAAAGAVLRRALNDGADLAIANRFGALEAHGGGLAAEMLALMSDGVPLITVVSEDYLMDWRWFTGKAGVELPPCLPALEDWFSGISASSGRCPRRQP